MELTSKHSLFSLISLFCNQFAVNQMPYICVFSRLHCPHYCSQTLFSAERGPFQSILTRISIKLTESSPESQGPYQKHISQQSGGVCTGGTRFQFVTSSFGILYPTCFKSCNLRQKWHFSLRENHEKSCHFNWLYMKSIRFTRSAILDGAFLVGPVVRQEIIHISTALSEGEFHIVPLVRFSFSFFFATV